MEERLQKILARAGLGSRRSSEELIQAGRVKVNGQVAELGSKADPERDRITVDGHPLAFTESLAYILLYKPRNVLSTVSAPDARHTVRDLVPVPGRLYPVGRLDVDSEGLILLTNDGELANRLTHPRYGHEKEYRVLVARQPDEEQLRIWRRGVVLEDGYKTQPADVRLESLQGKGAWLRVVLKEGRKRQIRETGALLGLPVVRIIRVRIGSLLLGKLQPGEWRHLSEAEVAALKGEPGRRAPVRGKEQARPEGDRPLTPLRNRAGQMPLSKRAGKSGEATRSRRKTERGRRR
jgi:23S rRNA pseudouridine2605 synthase